MSLNLRAYLAFFARQEILRVIVGLRFERNCRHIFHSVTNIGERGQWGTGGVHPRKGTLLSHALSKVGSISPAERFERTNAFCFGLFLLRDEDSFFILCTKEGRNNQFK